MTKQAHTPGDWVVVHAEGEIFSIQPRLKTIDRHNGGKVTALCPGPDRMANSLLIAAAPEMLAALDQASFELGQLRLNPRHLDAEGLTRLIRSVDSAISKARGEA